jgi:hypothetical protein
MTAAAIAGLLCGANGALWVCLLAPLRNADYRRRAWEKERLYDGYTDWQDARRRARERAAASGSGVARGRPGQGGRAVD